MNTIGCQKAIKQLVDDYAGVLVYDHYQHGTYRAIEEVSISVLTPPRQYYHIKIQVQDVTDASFGGRATNIAKPKRHPLYNCMIHVVDAAIPSGTVGEEQYEEAHTDFRTMCEGIAAMITGSYWAGGGPYQTYFQSQPICLADPNSNSKFSLLRDANDRMVKIVNMDQTWADPTTDVWTPILYSQISFRLEEQIV